MNPNLGSRVIPQEHCSTLMLGANISLSREGLETVGWHLIHWLVILGVVAFTSVSLAVFALAYRVTRQAGVLTAVAVILAIVALAPAALPGLG